MKTTELNLSDVEKTRLVNYSNTYYKKHGARVMRVDNSNAYLVQYLTNLTGNLMWENAFCVDRRQLNMILYGSNRKESVA